MEPRRLVTVYHGAECYCLVEEWDRQGHKVSRWHNDLTRFSIMRIALVVNRNSLSIRSFYGGRIGYVAEMPGCIISRKESPK